MISKAQVKHIQSLADKKYRILHGQFVVEGEKMVEELMKAGWQVDALYALKPWIDRHHEIVNTINTFSLETFELERISFLKSPQLVLAIVKLPTIHTTSSSSCLLLDEIQDPGNMGSLIRIADWYGIQQIYCSEFCADAYNPKVVQATMGSIFRVNIQTADLESVLKDAGPDNAYAAVLEGGDINLCAKSKNALIVIGNESKGIKPHLSQLCKHKVSIKRIGHAESLNAAVAAGIICHTLLS